MSWLLGSRIAAGVGGAYLLLVLVAFSLPYVTGESLAGLWAYLLSLPWSEIVPSGALDRVVPGATQVLGPASVLGGGVLNAVLLYLGVRWIESFLARRWKRTGDGSRGSGSGSSGEPRSPRRPL